jgi:hypothetical protein
LDMNWGNSFLGLTDIDLYVIRTYTASDEPATGIITSTAW